MHVDLNLDVPDLRSIRCTDEYALLDGSENGIVYIPHIPSVSGTWNMFPS